MAFFFFFNVDAPVFPCALCPAQLRVHSVSIFYLALFQTILNNKDDRLMAVSLSELKLCAVD
jgi:hypothetical protein